MRICARDGCTRVVEGPKHKKYCCHWCNITQLNRQRTPEYNAKQWQAYYTKNADELRQKSRDYRKLVGREALNASHRRWYKSNPGCLEHIQNNRRSAVESRLPKHLRMTNEEWVRMQEVYGGCAYCGAKTSPLTKDHIVPLSKGGDHSLHNVIPACRACNCAKWDQNLEDFLISDFLAKRKKEVKKLKM
jgi:5-methylcytosine-specific restriction endonuclease McrA